MSFVPRVAVVTDSTAYLPVGLAEQQHVTVVPLHIVLAGTTALEGRDVTPADVAMALASRRGSVTTSRPAPADFRRAYDAAAAAGATAVVTVHISGELSGTVASARLAAVGGPVEVRVVDSRSTAMGLGFAVLEAAEAAGAGADVDEVEQRAIVTAAGTTTLFCVDTLEYLRRGGRIGAAAALVGTALAVRPILQVVDGRIAIAEKVRTTSRAVARLAELAVSAAGDGPVDIAVHHLAVPERARALAERLRASLPGLVSLHVSEVGAAVGAHTGPGVLGVVVSRR